jgi:adenylate cyclase
MTHEELQALITQADEQLNKGNYDQAEMLANEVLSKVPSDIGDGAERQQNEIRASATRLFGAISYLRGDYSKALEHYNSALLLSEGINKVGISNALGNIGNMYWNLSDYSKALEYYGKALTIAEELGNKAGVAGWLGNIGIIHKELSDYPKALEYFGKALLIDEELGNKAGVARHLGNIGNVYGDLADYLKALEYFGKALTIAEELGNKAGAAGWLGNIGIAYKKLSDYPKALEYYGKAHLIDEELGNKAGVAKHLGYIGATYSKVDFEGFDAVKAEEFLLKALAILTEIGAKSLLVEFHKTLSELYEYEKRGIEALAHFKKQVEIEKEINIEEVKKQESIREQRKVIELAKVAADAKHQATEELLHHVLPPSIAHRMLEGEKLIAGKLSSVSILFADIVNFTKLSQRISAEELVEGLDRIFSSFDDLAEKHGLEKIKTIGDAYMVVAGAPVQREDHTEAMTRFALEIVDSMKEFTSKSTGEKILLRIGIHSGEVVAGVIGKQKFQYDLWGDAVNTAARMESHGEAGRIHISEDFRIAVETRLGTSPNEDMVGIVETHGGASLRELDIQFIPRGEIEIKGKGMMKTYFLERG